MLLKQAHDAKPGNRKGTTTAVTPYNSQTEERCKGCTPYVILPGVNAKRLINPSTSYKTAHDSGGHSDT
jgi:hypothetical protein